MASHSFVIPEGCHSLHPPFTLPSPVKKHMAHLHLHGFVPVALDVRHEARYVPLCPVAGRLAVKPPNKKIPISGCTQMG